MFSQKPSAEEAMGCGNERDLHEKTMDRENSVQGSRLEVMGSGLNKHKQ